MFTLVFLLEHPLALFYISVPFIQPCAHLFPLEYHAYLSWSFYIPFFSIFYLLISSVLVCNCLAQSYKNPCAHLAEQQATVAQDSPPFSYVCWAVEPLPSFISCLNTTASRCMIATCHPSLVNSMVHSQILGKLVGSLFISYSPLLSELMHRHYICHIPPCLQWCKLYIDDPEL